MHKLLFVVASLLLVVPVLLPQRVMQFMYEGESGVTVPARSSQWLMDEGSGTTAGDNVSTNDCTLVGSPTWTTAGIDFSGANDVYLDCGTIFNFDSSTDSYSISIMAKADALSFVHTLVARSNRNSPFKGYQIWVRFVSGNDDVEIAVVQTASSNHLQVENTNDVVTVGDWHHYVMTYDGSTNASGMKLYIDGAFISARDIVLDTLTGAGQATANFLIGAVDDAPNAPPTGELTWNGPMGEVSVWDGTELSAAEVSSLCTELESLMSGRSETAPTAGCS